MGHHCLVAAPSLIPKKPGDRVKTNRRDAIALAKLLRAGELTAVWVPDDDHEAVRDLVRARTAAVETLRAHRQQTGAFLLKHGRQYPGKTTWGARYLRWLQSQSLSASCAVGFVCPNTLTKDIRASGLARLAQLADIVMMPCLE
jgi:transposase